MVTTERTRHRPLAAGIVSETGALIWTVMLLVPFIWGLTLSNRLWHVTARFI